MTHWPASLDYLVNSRPVRNPFSRYTFRKQTRWHPRNDSQGYFLTHITHAYVYVLLYTYVYLHTHANTHRHTHTIIKRVGWSKKSLASYASTWNKEEVEARMGKCHIKYRNGRCCGEGTAVSWTTVRTSIGMTGS